ncbi:MAG: DEAD/DEAH box helicase, partial [Deltaproteobacteria bacterium]|nr:DEAD/DEAH box helicase [Deltaproteobacteria bacterium]
MKFIDDFKKNAEFKQSIVHHQVIPAEEAAYGELTAPLSQGVKDLVFRLGLKGLYSHQVKAIDAILEGHHVMVSSPTASGKTMIYNLPVIQSLTRQPDGRALYLFPLKALEQDQLKTILELRATLGGVPDVTAAIYDGDTPPDRRKELRKNPPNILITNPDMLHLGILAYHGGWRNFLKSLNYVVIDEVHTYKGIFGSHMVQILRRLRRLCRYYNASPRFILCSATIA